jgi:hypothetical protein
MKAGWMARRLNTLLHEMKLGPTADMTTLDEFGPKPTFAA